MLVQRDRSNAMKVPIKTSHHDYNKGWPLFNNESLSTKGNWASIETTKTDYSKCK